MRTETDLEQASRTVQFASDYDVDNWIPLVPRPDTNTSQTEMRQQQG